jgi:putative membrane-bound dehydrogenase-like protein
MDIRLGGDLMNCTAFITCIVFGVVSAHAQISKPADAPKPLPPAQSVKKVSLPDGFSLKLIASEPLIRQASGVCWDAKGRLFVCELHGYNMEGQYDIEELNKTGKLDRVVRRLSAPPEAVAKAEKVQTGAVKMLTDTDGDGVMDKEQVWADDLPSCFGLIPARDGVIVMCSPHIIFLADRDGDGKAEIRETLFTGFTTGILERRRNTPKWGPDGWIYAARGRRSRVTGPKLKKPVNLPATDFRFKPDGSAIEPITGGTSTIGYAFTEARQRFVATTVVPGIYVAPLPWHYLGRNPTLRVGRLTQRAANYNRVFPTAKPHPWRSKRANDKGFFEYYRKRYGLSESAADGYFTSGCSPFIYYDDALPGLRGQYFVCEPAGNMVHRALIQRKGTELYLERPAAEQKKEFLASADIWFHPMSIEHGPDGSMVIVDFYREIIEDYSAIPRYLQQQYGLEDGKDHGRIWRLVHEKMEKAPSWDMSKLDDVALAKEAASSYFWRRTTARRLLGEKVVKGGKVAEGTVAQLVQQISGKTSGAINSLYTLAAVDAMSPSALMAGLKHEDHAVRVNALKLSDPWLDRSPQILKQVVSMTEDKDSFVLLQLAMTLGESRASEATSALIKVAEGHSNIKWMNLAIQSSVYNRELAMFKALAAQADAKEDLLDRLAQWVAARRRGHEIAELLAVVESMKDGSTQRTSLNGLRRVINKRVASAMPASATESLNRLSLASDVDTAKLAKQLSGFFTPESAQERKTRIAQASKRAMDVMLGTQGRIDAIRELGAESDPAVTKTLISVFASATPNVRPAILTAIFAQQNRIEPLVGAMENKAIPPSALSAVQRGQLLNHTDAKIQQRGEKLFATNSEAFAKTFAPFAKALKAKRDLDNGQAMFNKTCAACHQVRGLGARIGPDLSGEMKRPEESTLKDILAPSSSITAGYTTFIVQTKKGATVVGLLVSEAPGNITLKDVAGKSHVVSRTDIASIKALNVSLMPEGLAKTLGPKNAADLIAWLRLGGAIKLKGRP